MDDVTHKQIYDRLLAVEKKVDHLERTTSEVVVAFSAAKGAFLVLEWIGKLAKPFLWAAAAITAVTIFFEKFGK